jgi:hypothetical protein
VTDVVNDAVAALHEGAVKAALVRPVEPEGDHLVCPFDIVLRPSA